MSAQPTVGLIAPEPCMVRQDLAAKMPVGWSIDRSVLPTCAAGAGSGSKSDCCDGDRRRRNRPIRAASARSDASSCRSWVDLVGFADRPAPMQDLAARQTGAMGVVVGFADMAYSRSPLLSHDAAVRRTSGWRIGPPSSPRRVADCQAGRVLSTPDPYQSRSVKTMRIGS